jgi:pantothenate kinase type III
MINRFKSELADDGVDVTVLATGGYSPAIAGEVDSFDHIELDLNLEGLRLVYEANR